MLRRKKGSWCAIGAFLACIGIASVAQAQSAFISEVFINPPGADNGFEGVEITGTPGMSLDGWVLAIIEGDAAGTGVVDAVISLSGQSIGANGVFYIRDAAAVLLPTPDPASTLFVRDFNPDIENGANTYVLGTGTFPAVATDLDTNNDGALDAPLVGFTVADAVALTDELTDGQYADDLGGTNLNNVIGGSSFAIYRILTTGNAPFSWAGGALTGTNPGPFVFSATTNFGWGAVDVDPTTRSVDLGTLNFVFVPNQMGACCFTDGSCSVLAETECSKQGGLYQGDNTTCKPNNCTQPTGACCFGNGSCLSLTSVDCETQGGVYQGNNTTCGKVNCLQPMGACCFTDGTCTVTTSASCAGQGGSYQGNGSSCKPNQCPQPTGACCFLDGSCNVLTSADCSAQGGAYQGNGTGCEPNQCPQPTGACCFADGTCNVLTSADCATQGGTYQGNDTTCSPNNCPQPTGACCLGDGSCMETTEAPCLAAGGQFAGLGTTCATIFCTPATDGPLYLSELFFNSVGTDQGQESLEIVGPPNFSLDGWFFIVIEGDGATAGGGTVDQKISLRGLTLGANGILLIRDSDTVIQPAPAAGTNVAVINFTPDIENGADTFVLGHGRFDPPTGTDLDTDNDGVLDVPFGNFTTVDAVSITDPANPPSLQYAAALGGENLGDVTALAPGALYRILDTAFEPFSWAGGFTTGTSPGPFFWSATSNFGFAAVGIPDPATRTLDLGTLNYVFGGPTGGCCLPGNQCTVVTAADCATMGGAYRGDGTSCEVPCPPTCPCDFNADLVLNSQDFFDFLGCFFVAECLDADFNGDTFINSQDFFDFLACFFAPPPGCN